MRFTKWIVSPTIIRMVKLVWSSQSLIFSRRLEQPKTLLSLFFHSFFSLFLLFSFRSSLKLREKNQSLFRFMNETTCHINLHSNINVLETYPERDVYVCGRAHAPVCTQLALYVQVRVSGFHVNYWRVWAAQIKWIPRLLHYSLSLPA